MKGCKVYRCDGWYHVEQRNERAHPWCFGREVRAEVPEAEDQYSNWLKALKERLRADILRMSSDPHGTAHITDKQPRNSMDMDWIYELDLDRELFLVDSQPLFKLSRLPSIEIFASCISFDSYFHRAYDSRTTPLESRFDFRETPTVVRDGQSSSSTRLSSVESVLRLPPTLKKGEALRVSILETLVGSLLWSEDASRSLRYNRAFKNQETSSDESTRAVLELAREVLCLSLDFFTFPKVRRSVSVDLEPNGWQWVQHQSDVEVCAYVGDQLDPDMLDSITSSFLSFTSQRGRRNPVYGIVFSLSSCAFLRLEAGESENGIHVSPVLPFLPSFYVTSPTTEGITAMARFGFWLQQSPSRQRRASPSAIPSSLGQVPIELWLDILDTLSTPSDAENLLNLTPQADAAARRYLSNPFVGGFKICAQSAGDVASAAFDAVDVDGKRVEVICAHEDFAACPDSEAGGAMWERGMSRWHFSSSCHAAVEGVKQYPIAARTDVS